MTSLKLETVDEGICDYHSLRKWIIKDKQKRSKQGVSDYWIESYIWYGKREYLAVIDACWLCETIRQFNSLRDASNWIKKMIY